MQVLEYFKQSKRDQTKRQMKRRESLLSTVVIHNQSSPKRHSDQPASTTQKDLGDAAVLPGVVAKMGAGPRNKPRRMRSKIALPCRHDKRNSISASKRNSTSASKRNRTPASKLNSSSTLHSTRKATIQRRPSTISSGINLTKVKLPPLQLKPKLPANLKPTIRW